MKHKIIPVLLILLCLSAFAQESKKDFFNLSDTRINPNSICVININNFFINDTSALHNYSTLMADSIIQCRKRFPDYKFEITVLHDSKCDKETDSMSIVLGEVILLHIFLKDYATGDSSTFEKINTVYEETAGRPRYIDSKLAIQFPYLKEDVFLTEEYILSIATKEYQEKARQLNNRIEIRIYK